MDVQDLTHRFEYHPPKNEDVKNLHASIRGECMSLAFTLNALLPEGREKALVITKLEEAMMWANAAVARSQAGG